MPKLPSKVNTLRREDGLPSSLIDLKFVRKLFEAVSEKSLEAKEKELSRLDELNTGEYRETTKQAVQDNWESVIFVHSTKGEQFMITDAEQITEEILPEQIDAITISMSGMYGLVNDAPYYSLEISLYFYETPPFDLQGQPGQYGLNNSKVIVIGSDHIWVESSFELIQSKFREKATKRGWLYQRSMYEILLLILGFPLSLFAIAKTDPYVVKSLGVDVSTGVIIAVQVFLFLIALQVIRVLFQYSRWAYPYMELKRKDRNKMWRHRAVHGSIILFIFTTVVDQFVDFIPWF